MKYRDALYNVTWELPKVIERLLQTPELVRARRIGQSVIPNHLLPSFNSIPSRCHHGLGVAYLGSIVGNCNPQIDQKYIGLLPVAGLLHDAGNSPMSHLSEPFLKLITGKDGESFLEDIATVRMHDYIPEVPVVLESFGMNLDSVIKLVTGQDKPMSDVLNGSIDIDNLNNLPGYNQVANIVKTNISPVKIASGFVFKDQWLLREMFQREVQEWTVLREAVYKFMYLGNYFVMIRMLGRALELAFAKNALGRDFFFLNDLQALEYLRKCDGRSRKVVDRAEHWQFYNEIFKKTFDVQPDFIGNSEQNIALRISLSDKICFHLDLEPEDLIVYMGQGKEKRAITIPFLRDDGSTFVSKKLANPGESEYMFGVYAFGNALSKSDKIIELLRQELNI